MRNTQETQISSPSAKRFIIWCLKSIFRTTEKNIIEKVFQRENKVKPLEQNDTPQAPDQLTTLLEDEWEDSENFYSWKMVKYTYVVYIYPPKKVQHNPEDEWNDGEDIYVDTEVNNKAPSHPERNPGPPEDKVSPQPEENTGLLEDMVSVQPEVNPGKALMAIFSHKRTQDSKVSALEVSLEPPGDKASAPEVNLDSPDDKVLAPEVNLVPPWGQNTRARGKP